MIKFDGSARARARAHVNKMLIGVIVKMLLRVWLICDKQVRERHSELII